MNAMPEVLARLMMHPYEGVKIRVRVKNLCCLIGFSL